MDLGHVDAGGVGNGAAHLLQLVIDRLSLPVGADDDPTPGRNLVNGIHAAHAPGGQLLDDVVVVDDRPQHHVGLAGFGDLLGQLHRPADAEAEACGLGQNDFSHGNASRPRALIFSIITSVAA